LEGSSISKIGLENDGPATQSLQYLAGYLAWKLKKAGKGIYGFPTGQKTSLTLPEQCPWTQLLSRGGLLIPNEEILTTVLRCEDGFNKNFDNLKAGIGICDKLVQSILQLYPASNLDIVKAFVDIRVKIKTNSLNENRRTNNINKRKAKQFSKSQREQNCTKKK
jgi:hypothetical protein